MSLAQPIPKKHEQACGKNAGFGWVALARPNQETAPALGETGEKKPTDNGWFLGKWWWGGTRHQTTIESTESKRCGLLRTGANSIEKPAATAIGRGRSSRFFALIGGRNGCSTSSAFRRPVQFPKRESNPRPSPRPKAHPFTPIPAPGGPPCGEWRSLSPHSVR